MMKMKSDCQDGIFDLVYLDAVHDFARDGLATCLLKKLVRPGGYLIFDDLNWNFGNTDYNSVTKPEINAWYTYEQIYDFQIQRVIACFMDGDDDWQEVFDTYSFIEKSRGIYKRIR